MLRPRTKSDEPLREDGRPGGMRPEPGHQRECAHL